MRTIEAKEITALVRELCMKANYVLPEDIRQSSPDGQEKDTSPLGTDMSVTMIDNCDIACKNSVPICQDCGMAIVFVEVGQDVHITGGLLEDAVNEGVRQGYVEGYLRLSVVRDPLLDRTNTNTNTPAILYTRIVAGDQIHVTVEPKGFGSENMSSMKMFTPAAKPDDIIDYVVSACDKAGSNPCPPIVIGIGLGGTADKAGYLAKRALMRPVGQFNENPGYAEMEKKIIERVNALGIGPQGLGGTVTALMAAIETFPTHIAGLPCVVNIGCHVTRHAEGVI